MVAASHSKCDGEIRSGSSPESRTKNICPRDETVYMADLKSAAFGRAGAIPVAGTTDTKN